jgi:iron complex outermembrane receptor protein
MAVDYGSFNTLGANYRLDASSDAIAMQIGLSHNSSDNDFDFAHGGKNENGRYRNSSVHIGLGVKVDANNFLRILTYAYSGERHFSLISPTDTKTKYRDRNERSLLEWVNIAGKLSSKFKAVYLNEHYDFFGNIANAASNFGNAQTLIARYDGLYSFNPKMAVNAIADFTETRATGSDLGRKTRQIASFAVLFKHRPIEKFGYEIGVRNEITDNYESPVLFSAGADYRFSPFYTLKVNASKNFRIPTLNDLYWLDGGNPDLKPETALQGEIGNVLTYKNWQLTITGYYASIQDMIQWLPGTTTFWNPLNINEARTYGIENMLGWSRKFGRHQLAVTGTYAYTVSENKQTGYQLIYVPYHKATGGLAYAWKHFSADWQVLSCGEVFTRSDNDPRYNIDSYAVSNLGAAYDFGKRHILKIGARVLNLFDENYQVVAGRPFPGRNYNLFLNLKF